MKFTYFASGLQGKIIKGVIEAASREDAVAKLQSEGLSVINLNAAQADSSAPQVPQVVESPFDRWRSKLKKLGDFTIGAGVKEEEKILFVNNLNLMLKSGVGLGEALATLYNQMESKVFKKVINHLLERVKNGASLSTALADYPKVFKPLFINIINIGEQSGNLEENLLYLGSELDKNLNLRKKITGAMIYPTIILVAGLGLGGVVVYYILPQITNLFTSMNVELPWTTKLMMAFSNLVQEHGALVMGSLLVFVVVVRYLITRTPLRYFYHYFLIKVPILGKIIRQITFSDINRTLYTLLKSGIPIIEAINITRRITTNLVYRSKLKIVAQSVNKGEPINKSLRAIAVKDPKLFPLMMITTIEIGEKTGRLEDVLEHLSAYYEREVDMVMKNLSTIIEPVLLLAMGGMVGFIAVSTFMPLYALTKTI